MFPFANVAPSARSDARGGAMTLLTRAPDLRDAVERVIIAVVKNLQTMAGTVTTIEGVLSGLAVDRTKDAIAAYTKDAAAALIECPNLGCTLLAILDATLVHAVVDLLCGGNGKEPPLATPRPTTPIDHQFSHIVFTLAAAAIQADWATFGFGPTRAVKIEGGLGPDLFGPRVHEVAVVKVVIGAFGLHGTLRLVMPPAALDRFRGATDAEAVETSAHDPLWNSQLHSEIGRTVVSLDAYLEARAITLASLAGLKVGEVLALPPDAGRRASLVADGRTLYRGEIGQDQERYTLRIEEIAPEPTNAVVDPTPPRRFPSELFKV